MEMPNFFVDPSHMGVAQVFWAFISYGYVLFLGANMIGDGSELLLLVPSLAGVVGSIVIPILGAVPDGMMVLFSGMQPTPSKAQEQISVGIGALAGSTIMLLTATAFVAIIGGRVDMKDGEPNYKARPKLQGGLGLFTTGVSIGDQIKANGKFMLLTAFTFVVIQYPALRVDKDDKKAPIAHESKAETIYALVGLCLCVVEFFVYCYLQFAASQGEPDEVAPHRATVDMTCSVEEFGLALYIQEFRERQKREGPDPTQVKLLPAARKNLHMFFKRRAGADDIIDLQEFAGILCDAHIAYTASSMRKLFDEIDEDKSGGIDFEEFMKGFKRLVAEAPEERQSKEEQEEEGEEDEDEMPEEWKDLSPADQQRHILMRSFGLMGLGSLLVLIFSDPMVDVLSQIGVISGVPAFYIAFLLAPVASNASELISTYKYAAKKTSTSITISFSTVIGAACMNNTYCLGIFFGLIYFQGLAWRFTAETFSLLFVQLVMGIVALTQTQLSLFSGLCILSLYPISLVIVLQLESMGYD